MRRIGELKILLLAALVLLLSACVSSQYCATQTQALDYVNKPLLLADLKQLSSDHMQGRKVNTQGSQLAQNFIQQRFQQLQLKSFLPNYRQSFNFGAAQTPAVNLIGYQSGRRFPQKYIVVTAHYDHLGKKGQQIYNGADDNASGVAAMLSIANYFKQFPTQHSLIFVATDAEEAGLHGAKAFIDNAPVPLQKIQLNVNLDMLAQPGKRNRLYMAGLKKSPQLASIFKQSLSQAKVCLVRGHEGISGVSRKNNTRINWNQASDHQAFWEAGIPYIYFGVDTHRHYHKPNDTFANIDPEFFSAAVDSIIQSVLFADTALSAQSTK
ncbi:M20/M25/M40 family metallo-hydrolase [Aliikangiella sp. IMCC44632]